MERMRPVLHCVLASLGLELHMFGSERGHHVIEG